MKSISKETFRVPIVQFASCWQCLEIQRTSCNSYWAILELGSLPSFVNNNTIIPLVIIYCWKNLRNYFNISHLCLEVTMYFSCYPTHVYWLISNWVILWPSPLLKLKDLEFLIRKSTTCFVSGQDTAQVFHCNYRATGLIWLGRVK